MAATVKLREVARPSLYAEAASTREDLRKTQRNGERIYPLPSNLRSGINHIVATITYSARPIHGLTKERPIAAA